MTTPVKRGAAALVALGLILVAHAADGGAAKDLENITDLQVVIGDLSSTEREEGFTVDRLKAEVVGQLKAKMPRARIADAAPDRLYLRLTVLQTETAGGSRLGYCGAIGLKLYREAKVLATGSMTSAVIWEDGAILSGPVGDASSHVNRAIAALVASFAVAYYEAGNP